MSDIVDQALEHYRKGALGQAAQLARQGLGDPQTAARAKGVMGLTAAKAKKFRDAAQFLTEAISEGAQETELPAALAHTFGRLNGPEATTSHLTNLLKSQPTYTALRVELAQSFHDRDDPLSGISICKDGIDLGDGSPDLLLMLGRAYLAAEQGSQAIETLRQYTAKRPDDADGHYLLGSALRAMGQLAEARDAQLAAMRQRPFHPRAFYSYMRGGRVSTDDPVVQRLDELESLLANADNETASYYHFGRGKAFEDLGKYDAAWEDYARGGSRMARTQRYNRSAEEKRIESIKTFFSAEAMAHMAAPANHEASPIFIVGMPRSGSTLVEQVLASHPQVTALGELLDLERIAAPVLEQLSSLAWDQVNWPAIGSAYVERVQARAGPAAGRIADKGLHNFRLIGLIAATLPNATILHTMRNPLDTCVSCLTLRFAQGHPWSNTQGDVAHYYRLYRDLMAHWDKVLPGRVTPVVYEDLVGDFEPQARQLVEACQLPWDEACLSFQNADRVVRTASSAQVRGGITTASQNRWQRFETHLDELKHELGGYL